MNSESGHARWSAIVVVSGVADVLEIGAYLYVFPNLNAIIHLANLFWTIVQCTVAEIKPAAAKGKIISVLRRKAIDRYTDTKAIIRSLPAGSGNLCTKCRRLVDLGISKGFLLAIVPAEPNKEACFPIIGQR